MTLVSTSPDAIAQAAAILKRGGLVAFPTETVYGLGADATQDTAIAGIYAAKGRPSYNPLIVHVRDPSWVAGIAMPEGRFDALARRFWPGPLTLVLRRRADSPISALVSAGQDTIAVRSPDHPIARDILAAVRRPIAAPSANASGRVSPTRAADVIEGLGDKVDLVIDGGPCRVGLESTVLDLTSQVPVILRPGSVTKDQLEAAIGVVEVSTSDPTRPVSPGQLASHYAPRLPLRLNAVSAQNGEAMLGFGEVSGDLNLSPAADLNEAAANLFAMLRALDQLDRYRKIAVAPVSEHGVGVAINDRLKRAAAPRD